MIIDKDILQNIISDEKERLSRYQQLCSAYQVSPDREVLLKSQTKIETIKMIIGLLSKN
jgi:hypothetical protein